jgi:hypothetical protein
MDLRPAPAGLPLDPPVPPVVAESDDPFSSARVAALVARLPRGRAIAVVDVVDALNAAHVDWLFDRRVVEDALIALQADWTADYRSTGGLTFGAGERGDTVTVEDSPRVDPWIVRRVQRLHAACREALDDFARRDRVNGE